MNITVDTGAKNWVFAPALIPSLVLALAFPLFAGLGVWQLDRAEQKHRLGELQAARRAAPALVLDAGQLDAPALEFRQVIARGRLDLKGQVLLENRHYASQNGFHVITPVQLAGSDARVLVNRGWVASAEAATVMPDSEQVELRGEATIPSPPALVLTAQGGSAVWGDRWPYLTVADYAAGVDYPVLPIMILQAPHDANGFIRAWPLDPPKEGMHIGYAIQWFAFAAATLVIYLRLSFNRTRKVEET